MTNIVSFFANDIEKLLFAKDRGERYSCLNTLKIDDVWRADLENIGRDMQRAMLRIDRETLHEKITTIEKQTACTHSVSHS